MGIGEVLTFYNAYKTGKKFSGSGAMQVYGLSSRVDVLIDDYAKVKKVVASGFGGAALKLIQDRLAAIIAELEPMTHRAIVLPGIAKDAAMSYVADAIEANVNVQMASNEMRRIEIEQFSERLPGSTGKKAYWPTQRKSLNRLMEAARSVQFALRGPAAEVAKEIEQAKNEMDGLRGIRNEQGATADDRREVGRAFDSWFDRENELTQKLRRLETAQVFFQTKADAYKTRIETGDVLWVKEQKK